MANNRRMNVATKYQTQLPVEYSGQLREEVQKITALRSSPKGIVEGPKIKPTSVKEQERMDTNP